MLPLPSILPVECAKTRYIQASTPVICTLGVGVVSNTFTINAVNPNLVEICYGGFDSQGSTNNPALNEVRVEKTSTTANSVTFTVIRNTASASPVVNFYATAVEWTPSAVESVDYGVITTTSTADATGLASVDVTRTVVTYIGASSAGTILSSAKIGGVFLKSATAVTASHGFAQSMTIAYCRVQYRAAVVVQLETSAVTFNDNNSLETITLSGSYPLASSVLFWGGINYGSAGYTSLMHIIYFDTSSNPTSNVILERQGVVSGNRIVYFTVVQFIPAFFRSITAYNTLIGVIPP